jgi:hypothetical protein
VAPLPRSILRETKSRLRSCGWATRLGLVWSLSGDEILFAAAAYGFTNSLYAVNRSGHQRLIAHFSGNFAVLDIAPDGRLLMSHTVTSNALFYLRKLRLERNRPVLARYVFAIRYFSRWKIPIVSRRWGRDPKR